MLQVCTHNSNRSKRTPWNARPKPTQKVHKPILLGIVCAATRQRQTAFEELEHLHKTLFWNLRHLSQRARDGLLDERTLMQLTPYAPLEAPYAALEFPFSPLHPRLKLDFPPGGFLCTIPLKLPVRRHTHQKGRRVKDVVSILQLSEEKALSLSAERAASTKCVQLGTWNRLFVLQLLPVKEA